MKTITMSANSRNLSHTKAEHSRVLSKLMRCDDRCTFPSTHSQLPLKQMLQKTYAIFYTNSRIVPDVTNETLLYSWWHGTKKQQNAYFFSLVSQQISCQDIFFTFPCSKVQNRNKRCCLPVFDHSILGGSQKTVLLSFNLATQKQLHSKLQGFCYRDHKGMSISSLKHVFTNKSDY